MPHFTLQISPLGPLVSVLIGVSESRKAALIAANFPVPALVQLRALVDTGASTTCVDPAKIAPLQLTPTGTVQMMTPSTGVTPHTALQYDVCLYIPGATANHTPHYVPTVGITESDLSLQGIDALLGRDILKDCLLTYNGSSGFFTLAF